jgi:hypothetical protein
MKKLNVSKVLSIIAGVVDIFFDQTLITNICATFPKNLKQLFRGHGRN